MESFLQIFNIKIWLKISPSYCLELARFYILLSVLNGYFSRKKKSCEVHINSLWVHLIEKKEFYAEINYYFPRSHLRVIFDSRMQKWVPDLVYEIYESIKYWDHSQLPIISISYLKYVTLCISKKKFIFFFFSAILPLLYYLILFQSVCFTWKDVRISLCPNGVN